MPAEHDDESTRFDSRPWGGQQRLIPLANRFMRPAASTAQPAVPTAPHPARSNAATAVAPPRRTAKGTRQPRLSAPVEKCSPVPSMTYPATIGAPVASVALPVYVGPEPMPASTAMPTVAMRPAAMHAPAAMPAAMSVPTAAAMAAPIARAMPATTRPSAIPAYSVKHGRAMGPFIVPHLPKVAQVFTADEPTIAVRRRPLTQRSLVAVPLGALSAIATILVMYFTQPAPSTKPTALGASALQAESHVMKATLEPEAERHVMTATIEPTIEAAAPAPAIVVEEIADVADVDANDDTEVSDASEDRPSRRGARTSKRQGKPRRIVAVDSSTPLGNLRPGGM